MLVLSSLSTNQVTDTQYKSNTQLTSFYYSEAIAKEVEGLITLDGSNYQLLSQQYKKILTTNLYNEYFPSSSYLGSPKSVVVTENSVVGEIESPNTFLFKLNLSLWNGNNKSQLIWLVSVTDGLVTNIQSLG